MGQDLAVGRLRHIVSGALQRRGPPSGNPMGSMEGACGVNAKSEDAEYSAKHHHSGKGCDAECETYVKCLMVLFCEVCSKVYVRTAISRYNELSTSVQGRTPYTHEHERYQ